MARQYQMKGKWMKDRERVQTTIKQDLLIVVTTQFLLLLLLLLNVNTTATATATRIYLWSAFTLTPMIIMWTHNQIENPMNPDTVKWNKINEFIEYQLKSNFMNSSPMQALQLNSINKRKIVRYIGIGTNQANRKKTKRSERETHWALFLKRQARPHSFIHSIIAHSI